MQSRFVLVWNEAAIAEVLGMTVPEVRQYMCDGRRASFIIERRLKREQPGWSLAPSEGAGYDLSDPQGGKWEVRCLTNGGVYFNPSNQVGSGRKFGEDAFIAKLRSVKGFILADIVKFPKVDVYTVPTEKVQKWYKEGMIGTVAKVSRATFLARLMPDLLK